MSVLSLAYVHMREGGRIASVLLLDFGFPWNSSDANAEHAMERYCA